MKMVLISFILMISIANGAYASHTKDHVHEEAIIASTGQEVTVQPQQVVVTVKGVVCSFCAYGTEKNLSKLTFLDRSKFGDNGVLMDIHSGKITLAVTSGQVFDLKSIEQSIKKGGYDPVNIYFRLSGQIQKKEDETYLTHRDNGQVFLLLGPETGHFADNQAVVIQVYLDAAQIPLLTEGQPIPVVVQSIGSEA